MKKKLKINVPNGYVIDKEESTFEYVVFKKIDNVIKWNENYNGVEIKADGEHFVIEVNRPSYYCTWDDAVRFYNESCMWKLPTVKQLQVLAKHIDKVNEVIQENNGYKIYQCWYWSCEEVNKFKAWFVHMSSGDITHHYKYLNGHHVRGVHNL